MRRHLEVELIIDGERWKDERGIVRVGAYTRLRDFFMKAEDGKLKRYLDEDTFIVEVDGESVSWATLLDGGEVIRVRAITRHPRRNV